MTVSLYIYNASKHFKLLGINVYLEFLSTVEKDLKDLKTPINYGNQFQTYRVR